MSSFLHHEGCLLFSSASDDMYSAAKLAIIFDICKQLLIFEPDYCIRLQRPGLQRRRWFVAGMLVKRRAGFVIRSNNRIKAPKMKKIKGVCFELFERFAPYSFAAIFRRDIHAQSSTSVSRIEIEKIDATDCKTALL